MIVNTARYCSSANVRGILGGHADVFHKYVLGDGAYAGQQ